MSGLDPGGWARGVAARGAAVWIEVSLLMTGLALVALVVATALGSPDLGLFGAGAIVVGELLWSAGSRAMRSWRRRHVET